MRDYHNFSYADIAKILGIANGSVMSRLHRARMALREILVKKGFSLGRRAMNVEQTEMNDEKFEKISGYLRWGVNSARSAKSVALLNRDLIQNIKVLYQELSMMRTEIQSLEPARTRA